jgi:hypothetical protein
MATSSSVLGRNGAVEKVRFQFAELCGHLRSKCLPATGAVCQFDMNQ